MKKKIILLVCLSIPLLCMAQNLKIEYDYDQSGNRTSRKTIYLSPPLAPPAPPEDLVHDVRDAASHISATTEYFVEKIAQVEMKIYPNPATEKITLSISNMDKLQSGTLQLYSMTGQLLQTRLLNETEVDVSLVGLSNGAYLLRVQVNNIIENWKIVKQ